MIVAKSPLACVRRRIAAASSPLGSRSPFTGTPILVDARDIYPPGHKIDDAYLDHFRPLAEQRVRQAAWRLAQVLDQALR